MAGMIEVAKATVTIVPTMEGAQQQITEDLTGATDQAADRPESPEARSWAPASATASAKSGRP